MSARPTHTHIHAAITDAVQKSGGRMTTVRTRIIALLGRGELLTIGDIVAQTDIDEVSVYRTIAFFTELGFIEEVHTPHTGRRFALVHGHHDHIVCRSCGLVAHVPCTKQTAPVIRDTRFVAIDTHSLTYFGTCTTCGV